MESRLKVRTLIILWFLLVFGAMAGVVCSDMR